jgi:hypothetical protein
MLNVLNSNVVLSQNNTVGPSWLTPMEVHAARLVKVSVQVDC